MKISMEEKELNERYHKLRNKFKILAFVAEEGIGWAKIAMEGEDNPHFATSLYIACYEAGVNN